MNCKRLIRAGCKYLTDTDYRFRVDAGFGRYDKMPDEDYLKRLFKASTGKPLNLENPQTFNEKMQWLKLHDRRPEYTMMVDKYLVRDYVKKTIGEQYLIPLLGVWDDPDEIDFNKLPNQFVLKCNHNSGYGMCICTDKSKLDIKKVKKELKKGLAQDYYLTGREWPYKNVPRKIVAEQYLSDGTGASLDDYKVHNFNGRPEFILVCRDRFSKNGLREDFFDTNWKHLKLKRPTHPNSEQGIDRPDRLDEILELSKALSQNIPFVRTDFYIVNNRAYFGEMTFFPASGLERFEPEEYDAIFGKMVQLFKI